MPTSAVGVIGLPKYITAAPMQTGLLKELPTVWETTPTFERTMNEACRYAKYARELNKSSWRKRLFVATRDSPDKMALRSYAGRSTRDTTISWTTAPRQQQWKNKLMLSKPPFSSLMALAMMLRHVNPTFAQTSRARPTSENSGSLNADMPAPTTIMTRVPTRLRATLPPRSTMIITAKRGSVALSTIAMDTCMYFMPTLRQRKLRENIVPRVHILL
mmetsp:Transcript_6561/g.12330  ORF Transcript_6561/g.12330 Transcript_6561/m.12330 type:complete len:217 (+) Transcript_6561:147-797(+)